MEEYIIRKYIARDGTIFNSKEHCEVYEIKMVLEKNIYLLNETGVRLSITEDNLKKASYLSVQTEMAGQLLYQIFDSYELPWANSEDIKCGTYLRIKDNWVHEKYLNNKIKKLIGIKILHNL